MRPALNARLLGLVGGVLLGTLAQAAERPVTVAGADSLSLVQARLAMRRSLLLPGWGQATNEEWFKSAAFAVAEVGLLVGARMQHNRWQDWKKRRKQAFLGSDPFEQEWTLEREEFYLEDRNKLLWWWMFVRLGGVLDAYVGGAMSNFSDEGPLEVGSLGLAGPGGLPGITLTLPAPWQAEERGR